MKVVETYIEDRHAPQWKFHLGPETYETRDTPARVVAIRKSLKEDGRHSFLQAHPFPERFITKLHPYHDFILRTSESISDPKEEIYPDLFPGEGANLPKRVDRRIWGGIWCTDTVTPIMQMTYAVARASAETALSGAELLIEKREQAVYTLCRPSGHHAGPRVYGGYCYFNNVATAAEYLAQHGAVAVIDIDYHHGNGTQEFFQERKYIFTASIHGDPSVEYPYYWGYADEIGIGQGLGSNLNVPLPVDTGIREYMPAVERVCEAIAAFRPNFLIIAVGFDTHASDPIGRFALQTEEYETIAREFHRLGLPTLICQEGGYNVEVLGDCVRGFLSGFESD